jgi:hypothetical protein
VIVRKVGAQRLLRICLGTRIAKVHTAERRLRFSIVVRLYAASCIELMVIPKAKNPKRELLVAGKKDIHVVVRDCTHKARQTIQ